MSVTRKTQSFPQCSLALTTPASHTCIPPKYLSLLHPLKVHNGDNIALENVFRELSVLLLFGERPTLGWGCSIAPEIPQNILQGDFSAPSSCVFSDPLKWAQFSLYQGDCERREGHPSSVCRAHTTLFAFLEAARDLTSSSEPLFLFLFLPWNCTLDPPPPHTHTVLLLIYLCSQDKQSAVSGCGFSNSPSENLSQGKGKTQVRIPLARWADCNYPCWARASAWASATNMDD